MKLTDLIISGLLKKGVMWEARAIEISLDIPGIEKPAIVKIEQMSIKFEKDDKAEA